MHDNTFILILVASVSVLLMLIFLVPWHKIGSPLKPLINTLGGTITNKGEGYFVFNEREFFFKYTAQGRNTPASMTVSITGNYGSKLLIRYENSMDRFYKQIGLNLEPQILDREVNDKLYFECDDQGFVNQLFLKSDMKAKTFELLTRYSNIEITPKRCLLKVTSCPDLKNITKDDVLSIAREVLDFSLQVPAISGGQVELFNFKLSSMILYVLGTLILVVGIVFLVWAEVSCRVVDSLGLWMLSGNFAVIIVLGAICMAYMVIRGFATSCKPFVYFLIVFTIGTALCGRFGTAVLNSIYDKSSVKNFDEPVIDKYLTHSKRSTYYHVVVHGWRPNFKSWHFQVSSSEYNQVQQGRTIYRISTRAGWLGYEWVVSECRI